MREEVLVHSHWPSRCFITAGEPFVSQRVIARGSVILSG